MEDTDETLIPESPEVRAEKQQRVYGEGWETGHGKTRGQEARDTALMLSGAMIGAAVAWLILLALAIWVF